MLKPTFLIVFIFSIFNASAQDLPSKYTELLKFVQPGPDQGETGTCLFVASTGAMELLANKREGIVNPQPYGKYDLSESYLINARVWSSGKSFWEEAFLRFNWGYGIHIEDWPYDGWNDQQEDPTVWYSRNMSNMKKIQLPKVETIRLFIYGNRWSTRVLNDSHVQQIKAALWKYKSPILVNYNDDGFWHVVTIVGYDDNLPGNCYDKTPLAECADDIGSFYVRDSFGITVEVRDYDWFRIKGNAAFVTKEANL